MSTTLLQAGTGRTSVPCQSRAHSADQGRTPAPRLSIGMPVFNGESFVSEALDSLLSQTFEDFELIISDNASTDGTEAICRAYAARDPRVKYHRNEQNCGAARNFNRCFALARGEYFKWAAHDDKCEPPFLQQCVEVLDRWPEVVLCHPRTAVIAADGAFLHRYALSLDTASPRVDKRFRELVCVSHASYQIFGVIRSSALKRTSLIGGYVYSDVALLGELAMLGRLWELPEYLFIRRTHPGSSNRANRVDNQLAEWFDPANHGRLVMPQCRLWWEHVKSVVRAPLRWRQKCGCYTALTFHWLPTYWRQVGGELKTAAVRKAGRSVLAAAGRLRAVVGV